MSGPSRHATLDHMIRSGRGAFVALAVVVAGGGGCRKAEETPRPDIVVVVADDLGYGDLSCYGATRIRTPRLDALAERGVRFTDAHAAASVCSPSRYGLLTGRYPWRAGLHVHLEPEAPLVLEPGAPTLARILHDHGYATACIGKWHLGFGSEDRGGSPETGPLDVGFDRYFGAQVRWKRKPRCWISDRRWVGWRDGEIVPLAPGEERTALGMVDSSELPGALLAETARFLEAAGDRPVFLLFTPFHVHTPHLPGREFVRSSEAGSYGDFVQELDWLVGELLALLERAGRRHRALVFVTSDNGGVELDPDGPARGHRPNANLRGHKPEVWEGGHRVPLLAEWPGRIPPGRVFDGTVSHLDLVATCLAAAGIDPPEGTGSDGVDLYPLLRDGDMSVLREETVHLSRGATEQALRRGRWKLVLRADGSFELYDLDEDPSEQHDRAAENPDLVEDLAERLARYGVPAPAHPGDRDSDDGPDDEDD